MIVRFSTAARRDRLEAERYYAEASQSARDDFRRCLESAIQLTLRLPQAGPANGACTRRMRVHAFPYDVIYSVERDCIYIVAVAHHARRPGYWRDRL